MGGRCFSHPIQFVDCALESYLSSVCTVHEDLPWKLGGLHVRGMGRSTFGVIIA